MKKILIPIIAFMTILVIFITPIIRNMKIYETLGKNGYEIREDEKNIVNGYYLKSDDEGIYVYYLNYRLFNKGIMSYTRNMDEIKNIDEIEVDYDGKKILYNRSSCEMVKNGNEFELTDESSAKCLSQSPDQNLINKVVKEYDTINH